MTLQTHKTRTPNEITLDIYTSLRNINVFILLQFFFWFGCIFSLSFALLRHSRYLILYWRSDVSFYILLLFSFCFDSVYLFPLFRWLYARIHHIHTQYRNNAINVAAVANSARHRVPDEPMIAEVDETTTLAGMGAQEQTIRVCVCWLAVCQSSRCYAPLLIWPSGFLIVCVHILHPHFDDDYGVFAPFQCNRIQRERAQEMRQYSSTVVCM